MARPKATATSKANGKATGKPAANAKGKGRGKTAAASAKPDKAAKKAAEIAGIGHNQTTVKKLVAAAVSEYEAKVQKFENFSGHYRQDMKELVEKHSNAIGCTRKLLRMVLQEQHADRKAIAREKNMEPEERNDLDKLRDAANDLFEAADQREARSRRDTAGDPDDGDDGWEVEGENEGAGAST